ncbi:hypothetical protein PR202_gb04620 [Eleusine coracana subsp. coracana]|uniref:Uncharacterized protein n=1 Tax=Eleusine coracana subsp. coracana TaxID=191504 RepID=A0AAV5E501_ELECO|nr:hypothetical protein PR202_gb04620 [Eleusine coracana subsp. coracana]
MGKFDSVREELWYAPAVPDTAIDDLLQRGSPPGQGAQVVFPRQSWSRKRQHTALPLPRRISTAAASASSRCASCRLRVGCAHPDASSARTASESVDSDSPIRRI